MEKKDRYISIGEMAKINRTTVPTLRLYDSMGRGNTLPVL